MPQRVPHVLVPAPDISLDVIFKDAPEPVIRLSGTIWQHEESALSGGTDKAKLAIFNRRGSDYGESGQKMTRENQIDYYPPGLFEDSTCGSSTIDGLRILCPR
jgi:hypothetical protein